MSTTELAKKLREYKDLKELAAELADNIAAIEDEIKRHMGEQEELSVQGIKISYTKYETSRFDSATFKQEHSAMYELYTKKTSARRFAVR